jgi:hypothetical protein
LKNLFDHSNAAELKERASNLQPDTPRQWGKMLPAQALAHCAVQFEMVLGENFPPRAFIGYIFGPLAKKSFFSDKPVGRNMPTIKEYVVNDERDLDTERTRLFTLIDRLADGGPSIVTQHPHAFFGKLTPEEWAVLMYKHVDHHLKQFGA